MIRVAAIVSIPLVLLVACRREERRVSELAPLAVPIESRATSDDALRMERVAPDPVRYEESAFAVAEGQRLFTWYNCVGCHGQGGGGSGPALMDSKWRYGSEPNHLYATIVEGRPNGMPSFRGKIPAAQVWQLVAYVRALAGYVRLDATPGRADTLTAHPPAAMQAHDGTPPSTREVALP